MSKIADIREKLALLVTAAWGVECDPYPDASTPESGAAWIAIEDETDYALDVSGGRTQPIHTLTVVTFIRVTGGSNPAKESKTEVDERVEKLLDVIEGDVTLERLVEQAIVSKVRRSSGLSGQSGIESGARIEIEVTEWDR